jgi:cysteine desulfurase / selenocysteine lyase
MIYFDNSATSHPKPRDTRRQVDNFIRNVGGNPGRGSHGLSVEAARIVFEAREELALLVGAKDSKRLIFTQNGTDSLNLAILGLLGEHDHVITTSMEHNSVMRPLTFLTQHRKVEVSVARCGREGQLDLDHLRTLMRAETRAVIVNHGSNVTGAVQGLADIRAAIGNTILIVDACQTIGAAPIDVEADGIDALCFSCHKSLYGLQGLGALYLRPGIDPKPLKFGGTGSRSESLEHPTFLPDRYEAGTPNTPGIASLLGGLAFIARTGLQKIIKREKTLTDAIVRGLRSVPGTVVYGHHAQTPALPVISFTMGGKLPSQIGYELNKKGIYVRVGLHCSPAAHRTIGTFPEGTVRVSPGYFNTRRDISTFLEVIEEIAQS